MGQWVGVFDASVLHRTSCRFLARRTAVAWCLVLGAAVARLRLLLRRPCSARARTTRPDGERKQDSSRGWVKAARGNMEGILKSYWRLESEQTVGQGWLRGHDEPPRAEGNVGRWSYGGFSIGCHGMCRQIWANFPAVANLPNLSLLCGFTRWRVGPCAYFCPVCLPRSDSLIHGFYPLDSDPLDFAGCADGSREVGYPDYHTPIAGFPHASRYPIAALVQCAPPHHRLPSALFFTQLVQLFSSDTSQKATRVRTAASRVRLTSATATARREPTAGLVSPCPLIRSLAHPFHSEVGGPSLCPRPDRLLSSTRASGLVLSRPRQTTCK